MHVQTHDMFRLQRDEGLPAPFSELLRTAVLLSARSCSHRSSSSSLDSRTLFQELVSKNLPACVSTCLGQLAVDQSLEGNGWFGCVQQTQAADGKSLCHFNCSYCDHRICDLTNATGERYVFQSPYESRTSIGGQAATKFSEGP